MRLAKSLTMLVVCISLCCLPVVCAQAIQTPEAEDRPTQRWLPLPQSDGIDLSEQAKLLQQLRDLMSVESQSGGGDSPFPKLSEQQLREMEQALDDLREQIGKDKLPNLENIPKEWIDQALTDPTVRKQAEQLLEQYARDRKFPTPNNRTPLNSDGVPFPRRNTSEKTPNQNSKSGSKPGSKPSASSQASPNFKSKSSSPDSSGPKESDQTQNLQNPNQQIPNAGAQKRQGQLPDVQPPSGQQEEQPPAADELQGSQSTSGEDSEASSERPVPPRPVPPRPLPSRPDAERIEALQELFKKLKTIEGQRQTQKNGLGKDPGATSSRNSTNQGNLGRGNSNSGNGQSASPNASGSQPTPGMPRSSRTNPKSTAPLQERSPKESPKQPGVASPGSDASNDPAIIPNPFEPDGATPKSDQVPGTDLDKTAPSDSTSQERPSKPSTYPDLPGLRPKPSPSPNGSSSMDRVRRNWPTFPQESKPSPREPNSSASEVDIKTQLERHGLGRALQSIVDKTLKEQGEADSAKERASKKSAIAQSKSIDSKSANKPTAQVDSSTTQPNISSASKSSISKKDSPKANEIAQNQTAKNGPSGNPNNSSTMSGFRDMAAQFWGAIRSTPGEGGGGSSASSSSASGGGSIDYGFAWNGQVWLLVVLALIGIAMLVLIARKRVELATAAREAEAELAKEILTEGIRTRADVVRAFHRFVLRRAQPVANWWNHRYVASKLAEASPQLKSVISDLAGVYEQARYLPPEVTLSSEEIDRVQTALKQCAAV